MSASINTVEVLNAVFKQTYASELENAIPERELMLKSIPFVSADKQNGADYNQPVLLSRHHGVTYLGPNDNNLQLNPAIAAITQNASIKGSGMMMSGLLSTTAASRAVKGGPAFVDATSYLVEGLTDSFAAIHEQTMFYGGKGLATITEATYANTNATTDAVGGFGDGAVTVYGASSITLLARDLVVAYPQWASAIWVGAEGMLVDIYSSASAYKATLEIEYVDITNRIVRFRSVTGYTAADGDVIYRKQSFGLEAKGLEYIMSTDGSVFGIDNSQFGLWKGSRYSASGAIAFKKVAEAVSIAYGRGLEGRLDLHVNSKVFSDIIPDFLTSKSGTTDTAGRYFESGSEVEKLRHGSKAISFVVNNVECNLIANDYVKAGLAFGIAPQTMLRVGSSDMTFDIPGSSEKGEYFRTKDGYAALELRMYSDQALFVKAPARNILISGITVTKP